MSTAPNHLTALFVLSQRMVAAEWVDASSCYDLPHGLFPSSYSTTSFQLVSTRSVADMRAGEEEGVDAAHCRKRMAGSTV